MVDGAPGLERHPRRIAESAKCRIAGLSRTHRRTDIAMPSSSELLEIALAAAAAGAAVLADASRERDASIDDLGLRTKGAAGDVVTAPWPPVWRTAS